MKRDINKLHLKLFLVLAVFLFSGTSEVLAQEINYFLIEIEGGVLANSGTPEVSILRAQCRQRDRGIELQIQGAVHDPANALVTIRDADRGTVFGSIASVPDLTVPSVGTYIFDLGNDPTFLICPDNVQATIPGGTFTESAVDVRIDNAPAPPAAIAGFEIEGPMSSIIDNGDGTGTIVAMGIIIQVPAGTPIHTPVTSLTISQLADPTPLPGRFSPGFIGGTTIALGVIEDGVLIAEDIFAEPAENVALGIITNSSCTNSDCSNSGDFLELMGSRVVRITDPRMFAEPPKNAFGFEIDLSQGNLTGALAGVEGYFGENPPANNVGASTTIDLDAGWNLISIPIQPTDINGQVFSYTAETFGQFAGADLVSEWNSQTQQFNSHVVGFPLNDFVINQNKGFWAHVNSPQTLTINGVCTAGGA